MSDRSSAAASWHGWAILWYLVFGIVHETAHWTVAVACLGSSTVHPHGLSWKFWYDLFIGRQFGFHLSPEDDSDSTTTIHLIQHAGWIASLLLALWIELYAQTKKRAGASQAVGPVRWAAWVTALEAVWTDLLHWPVIPFLLGPTEPLGAGPSVMLRFACGNFGMILLHHAWWTHESGAESALNILEKLVQVTMMRGAQSGGVVCFHPHKKFWSTQQNRHGAEAGGRDILLPTLLGVRSRVVNGKRTDLSVLLRHKVSKDNHFTPSMFPKDFVPAFCGHTRFATSSKATLPDTHPQQWTPPSPRRVYNLSGLRQHSSSNEGSDIVSKIRSLDPQVVMVENFITHNGDFDFYRIHGQSFEVGQIQKLLEVVLDCPQPAAVDSCAVAGMIDLLRTQGCFGLSARCALCLNVSAVTIASDIMEGGYRSFPSYRHFETIGLVFEHVLQEMIKNTSLTSIDESSNIRESFAWRVVSKLEARREELFGESSGLSKYIHDGEVGSSIFAFCAATIGAFFDNDLLAATQTFLANASGSFGLCVTSSLDAHHQLCLAARGQTMSLGLYPRKGLLLYGSEQAAVKAGLRAMFPGDDVQDLDHSLGDVDNDALRLDLDDLGGEVVLLDFNRNQSSDRYPVSVLNRHLPRHKLMNGRVTAVVYQESKATKTPDPEIYHRMVRLSRNKFVKPLPDSDRCTDLILKDIEDIPKVCSNIQDDWHSNHAATSLNRLTAHTLARALRRLLDARVKGKTERSSRAVDILLTGCEVSLWLAEQFASDLQKAFPKLVITAISSNKLLGLYGQDVPVPAFGFPQSPKTLDLHDSIVIIVSHSGGSFAPLACCNLLQSSTKEIFAVTSEWDTQIGKQLWAMDASSENVADSNDQLFRSRIFSTGVGIRPAEPCSVSVVATHQLLTNLFMYISVLILSDMRYRHTTGATISEQDLRILERCNRDNLDALSEIVGVNTEGMRIQDKQVVESELREAGDLWADHILENARAYIMTFIYIFTTVISGHPLAFAIARAAGLGKSNDWIYVVHAIDASIYFWLPQINIFLLRLIQRRNLRHRMVGRTVVIGDIPWVAQCAEAFLSKIFAVSYSIAGLNVMSGNPADHFVHRHTHRVVRGSLVICGRPDGRLSALTSAEASVCLSVNQASSIQSLNGTCESITIGHNPFKLPLSAKAIFLKRKRPLFFCERVLLESDADAERKTLTTGQSSDFKESAFGRMRSCLERFLHKNSGENVDSSLSYHRDSSVRPTLHRKHSAAVLLGKFRNFEESNINMNTSLDVIGVTKDKTDPGLSVDTIVQAAIKERKWSDRVRNIFQSFDLDNDGLLSEAEFIQGWRQHHTVNFTYEELQELFQLTDKDGSGALDYAEFHRLLLESPDLSNAAVKVPPCHRDNRGLIEIEPSREKYFGELLRKYNVGRELEKALDFSLSRGQHQAMELYESRIGSLQRFVSMVVMFHQMGRRVEHFFEKISCGLLAYRMDRTHSIMRIATTASPVSGADIRQQIYQLRLLKRVKHSVHVISMAWFRYKEAKNIRKLAGMLSSSTDASLNNGGSARREQHMENHDNEQNDSEVRVKTNEHKADEPDQNTC
ncbi:hypothetical protein ACA910_009849 [Epithemia clementina (nom. ined.)]